MPKTNRLTSYLGRLLFVFLDYVEHQRIHSSNQPSKNREGSLRRFEPLGRSSPPNQTVHLWPPGYPAL